MQIERVVILSFDSTLPNAFNFALLNLEETGRMG